MEKKPKIKGSKIHGLVIFKGMAVPQKTEESTYSFESVDQENKIKFVHELAPFTASYRYSIMLVNESAAPISDVKVRVKYPKFFSLSRVTPPSISIGVPKVDASDISQVNFEIDKLSENSQKLVSFYLVPIISGVKGKIVSSLTFVNNKDYVRVLNSNPVDIKLKEITITPKTISSSEIQNFLKNEGIKKAIKSFGIASKAKSNSNLYFNYIEQQLGMNKFQLIAKDEKKKISWYFGTDTDSNEDILIIGQITSNKVEFLGASNNHESLISILTVLSNQFKNHLLSTNLIDSFDDVYNLECKYCGGILQKFPKKGESIECVNCKKEQKVW
jgi:hypothetical protein